MKFSYFEKVLDKDIREEYNFEDFIFNLKPFELLEESIKSFIWELAELNNLLIEDCKFNSLSQ
jgi:hypothetical protein